MLVSASTSGFTNGEAIYIKGAFYKNGSSNYFGYTRKEEEWIKNGEASINQKIIKIGEWDNSLKVKSDFLDSGFKGEGNYKFKVGFYYLTSGDKLSSVNWSDNSFEIIINEPDPTPVPTSSPTPTKNNVNTNQAVITAVNYSPTPVKVTAINTRIPLEKLVDSLTASSEATSEDILGESTLSAEIDSSEEENKDEVKVLASNSNNIGKLLIGISFVFFTACGIVLGAKKFKRKEILDDK